MKKLTPFAAAFALFFLPVFSIAQQVGHVTEIRVGYYSEEERKETYRENVNFIYKDGMLARAEERGGDRETANKKPHRARSYFYSKGLRYLLVNSVSDFNYDTLIPSSKKTLWFTADTLHAGMQEMYYDKKSNTYYSKYLTLYSFLDKHTYRGYTTQQSKPGKWENFYRSIYDSTYTTGYRQLFQSYREGKFVTTAHIYFDSIRIVKGKLQFLLRSDDTDSDDRMYDKYVFTTKGAFVSYENWAYYSDVKKYTWNCSYIYESDASGRPSVGRQWHEEGESMEGTSHKAVIGGMFRYAYEPAATAAMATKRLGSFIVVDWCLDTGKPTEMILLDKDLKVKHYNSFPFGQPYFKADAVPPGTYYLIVFSREANAGGMLSIQL